MVPDHCAIVSSVTHMTPTVIHSRTPPLRSDFNDRCMGIGDGQTGRSIVGGLGMNPMHRPRSQSNCISAAVIVCIMISNA